MNKVILQPAGDSDASQHYVDTIKNPVDLSRIRAFVSEDEYNRLTKYYREGKAPVWGVTPGEGDVNYRKWIRIDGGYEVEEGMTIVVLYRNYIMAC